MKIAIVCDAHVGKPLAHNGEIRASSDLVMERLEPLIKDIVIRHKPDLLVNLGDAIRSEGRDQDLDRYHFFMKCYQSIGLPSIHLVGNHELKEMSLKDLSSVWKKCGFEQDSYGIKTVENFNMIWLGLEIQKQEDRPFSLPSNQLNWLKTTLDTFRQPTMIFIHCPIDDQNLSGNFFYEALDARKNQLLLLKNQNEVRQIIHSHGNVISVFQAHLHYFHAHVLNKIAYITCPAMGDNICGPEVNRNVPEIYTIATIDQSKITVKAYSRQYCFAGYEQEILPS